jgi:hypothetical protein
MYQRRRACAYPHAEASCVLKLLVILAEVGGVRHRFELHAAGPAKNAITKGSIPVGVPKVRQLRTVNGSEGVVDLGGQPGVQPLRS